MINWEQAAQLRSEVGEDEFEEVVELFLEEVDEVVTRLRSTPDVASLEEDLHFLKGSALNLGFQDFSALCQDGEKMAAGGQGAQVNLGAVLDSYDASRAIFLNDMATKLSA